MVTHLHELREYLYSGNIGDADENGECYGECAEGHSRTSVG